MPYGLYLCADGREVLFDRDYAPICERYPGQPARMADPTEWVRYVRQEWFHDDKTPACKRPRIAQAKLEEWGMLEPVMAEIDEAIHNSARFSWRRGQWIYPDASNLSR
jgi:hypothetical protein